MGFIFDGLVLVLLLIAFQGMFLFAKARAADRLEARMKQQAAEQEERKAAFERSMYRPGTQLICLACDPPRRFLGPLTEAGCPGCHTSVLVIPVAQYELQILENEKQYHNHG